MVSIDSSLQCASFDGWPKSLRFFYDFLDFFKRPQNRFLWEMTPNITLNWDMYGINGFVSSLRIFWHPPQVGTIFLRFFRILYMKSDAWKRVYITLVHALKQYYCILMHILEPWTHAMCAHPPQNKCTRPARRGGLPKPPAQPPDYITRQK